MTYSINVLPYNDPYVKVTEEAIEATKELIVAGAFLVDIIPILKYVPHWFPGANFQRKAAVLRKHAANIRNFTFAATQKLMVCDLSPPLFFFGLLLNYLVFSGQWCGLRSLVRHRGIERDGIF